METVYYILGIVFVVIGLAVSIGLHELGHLIPAKLFGVRVKQYMIGFGPTVWSSRRGETEYGIKGIPLGGYISMIGMFPPEKAGKKARLFQSSIEQARAEHLGEISEEDKGREFYRLSVPKKLTVMLGGPLMNFFLGMVLIMSALSFIGSPQLSMSINQVLPCVQGSGPQGECAADDPPSPALEAGFEAGDTVTAINGASVSTWDEAIERMNVQQGSSVSVEVERDGQPFSLTVTPVWIERAVFDSETAQLSRDENGEPVTELRPFLGVQLQSELRPMPIGDSFAMGIDATGSVFELVLQLPQNLAQVFASTFGPEERNPNGPISILGVAQISGEIAASEQASFEARLASGLLIMGSLNFALFVFNLIPLLPLDGGHVAGALYEGAKRRSFKAFGQKDPGPVDTARMIPLAYAVWALLLGTGLLLIIADIVNPISIFG